MSGMEEIYERLRRVEQDTALIGQKLDRVEQDLDRLERDKLDPMASQLDDLHTTMTRNKGFWAGAVFIIVSAWTVLGAAVVAIYRVFFGE